jgi:hypothetical protein
LSNQNLVLGIDARGARKGAADFTAAIDKMAKSVKQFDQIAKGGGNSGSSNKFRQMARDLNALSSVRVNPNLARSVQALSGAMAGLRGPNASAVRNFKALFQTLGRVNINPATARGLTAISTALAGFRAPSAAAVRNIQSLASTLATLRAPPNLRSVMASFVQIGNAAQRASQQLAQFNAQLSRSGAGRSAGAIRAVGSAANTTRGQVMQLTGSMRGLENAFSASYQVGSQLRVLFGALTVGQFTKDVYEATLATAKFNNIMKIASKSPEEVAANLKFVGEVAQKYGIEIEGAMESYGRLAVAMKESGVPIKDTQALFENASTAMRVYGLTAEQQKLVVYGMTQTFSKGVGSMEEFRRQIGEQLPGFFPLAQEVLREVTKDPLASLEDYLSNRKIDPKFLLLVFEKMRKEMGDAIPEAAERADAQIARLANSWFYFKNQVGDSGALKALADGAQNLTAAMGSDGIKNLATSLGQGLATSIGYATQAVIYLVDNIEMVKSVVKGLIGLQLGRSLMGMFTGASAGAVQLMAVMGPMGAVIGGGFALATAAAFAFSDELLTIGGHTASVQSLMLTMFSQIGISAQAAVQIFRDAGTAIAKAAGAESAQQTIQFWVGAVETLKDLLMQLVDTAFYVGQTIGNALKRPFQAASRAWAGDFKGAMQALNPKDWYAEQEKYAKEYADRSKERWTTNGIEQIAALAAERDETIKLAAAYGDLGKSRVAGAAGPKKDNPPAPSGYTAQQVIKTGGDDDKAAAKAAKENPVIQRAKDAADALKDYKIEVAALNAAMSAGVVSNDAYARSLQYQKEKLQEAQDPYAALVRSMQEEINLAQIGGRAGDVRASVQAKVNDLMSKGVAVTQEMIDKLTQLETQKSKLGDTSSLEGWVAGLESVEEATDRVATQALDGLADGIADLVVDGKADFRSLAKSILKEFVKIAVNQVYKSLFSGIGGGPQQIAPITVDQTKGIVSPTSLSNSVATQNVTAGTVYVNGAAVTPGSAGMGTLAGQYGQYRPGTVPGMGAASSNPVDLGAMRGGIGVPSTYRGGAGGTGVDLGAMRGSESLFGKEMTNSVSTGVQQGIEGLRGYTSGGGGAANPFGAFDAAKGDSFSGFGGMGGGGMGLGGAASQINKAVSSQVGSAVDKASALLGKNETANTADINQFLKAGGVDINAAQTAWCSGFVNSSLKQVGVDGSGNLTASSFLKWGSKVDPAEAMKGDVLVSNPKGVAPGTPGAHVGMATGQTRNYNGMQQTEMLSGNAGKFGEVNKRWYNSDQLSARRAPGATDPAMAQGIDPATTGSITQANTALKQTGTQMQTLGQQTQAANTALQTQGTAQQTATQQKTMATQTETMAAQQSSMAHQMNAQAVQMSGTSAQTAAPAFTQAGTSIQTAGMQAQSAGMSAGGATGSLGGFGSGIAGLAGPLSQATSASGSFGSSIMQLVTQMMSGMGGGGGMGGGMGMLGGLFGGFKEGGISTKPVSRSAMSAAAFANAPSYKEGTTNTGKNGMGGIPAKLHPNEAVIPLSRGRSIPVEMNDRNGSSRSGGGGSTNVTMNISGVSDVDGFKRSEKQIQARMAASAQRASQRNN